MAIKKTPTPKTTPSSASAAKKQVSTKKTPAAARKAVAKKATTRSAPKKKAASKAAPTKKKAPTQKVAATPKHTKVANAVHEAVTPEQRYKMISTMAYFRAEQRGFEPGWETHDWLESEREVDEMLRRRQTSKK